ncbi:hypothetical protein LI253_18665, partial [Gordonibacter pamelaeae]|nr:hypothetical protein [Gordonibacter pamelaeae]
VSIVSTSNNSFNKAVSVLPSTTTISLIFFIISPNSNYNDISLKIKGIILGLPIITILSNQYKSTP